jgi:hypothetical protein
MTMAYVRGRRASLTTRAVIAAVLVLAAGSVPGQPGAAALAEGAQARGQRAVAPASEERGAVIRAIAATPLPQGDRITIELSKEVRFEGQRVTNPDRVFFDFTNANAASVLIDRARAIKSPLIKTVRVGVPTPGVTRVVFELAGEPRFSSFPLYNPFRLVIDLENAAPAAPVMPVSTVPAPAPGPAMPPVAEVPAPVATTDKRGWRRSSRSRLPRRERPRSQAQAIRRLRPPTPQNPHPPRLRRRARATATTPSRANSGSASRALSSTQATGATIPARSPTASPKPSSCSTSRSSSRNCYSRCPALRSC